MRDRAGEPTGILKDEALDPVFAVIPPPTESQSDSAIARALKWAASKGVTAVADVSVPWFEVAALKRALGARAREIPVTAPKTTVGRLYAGGAPLDVAAALFSMRDGVIPPTVNLDEPANGNDLDFVTGKARSTPVDVALVTARGYGGFNAALVLRRVEHAPG